MKKKLLIFLFTLLLFSACSRKVFIGISCMGKWSGAISEGYYTTRSVEGTGYQEFSLGDVDYAGAVIQKGENNNSLLDVVIRSENSSPFVNDKIDESGSTSAGYGVVSIGHSYD